MLAEIADLGHVPLHCSDRPAGETLPHAACLYYYTITEQASVWHAAAQVLLCDFHLHKLTAGEWGLLCVVSELAETAAHLVGSG